MVLKQAPAAPTHSGSLRRHAAAGGGTAGGRTLALFLGPESSVSPAKVKRILFSLSKKPSYASHPPPLATRFSHNWWDLLGRKWGGTLLQGVFPKLSKGDIHGRCSYELDLIYDICGTPGQNPEWQDAAARSETPTCSSPQRPVAACVRQSVRMSECQNDHSSADTDGSGHLPSVSGTIFPCFWFVEG